MHSRMLLAYPMKPSRSAFNKHYPGNPMPDLGESISFGRFMSESLSWDKWSLFSHNRYVEEAERYAQPGAVAQKKAFFEAHYKRIAAKKAAALLEQANAANSNPEAEFEDQSCDSTANNAQSTTTNSLVPLCEQIEVKIVDVNVNSHSSGAEMKLEIGNTKGADPVTEPKVVSEMELEIGKMKRADLVTEHEVVAETMKDESLDQFENVVTQNLDSESPQMEKPLLEGFKSCQEAPSPVSKKKPAILSLKSSGYRREPKVPASPAKSAASIHPRKDNSVTPITGKSPIDAINKKKANSKSLHMLIFSTPAKEPDKSTTQGARRAERSRVAPGSYRAYKDCKTPLKTPTMTNANGVLKNPSATPCSENKRPRTPVAPSATGSKTTGPKWRILSAVSSKSLSACKNKLQSPTLSTPFSFRTEERAARRKQKLEEKFIAKEAEKVQLQTRLKVKAETELRNLRQSLCFKARPLPDFYKERETPKNQINNVKTPLTHPQSPKLGRKPSPITLQGITSLPPETKSTKNSGPKNVLKKKNQIPKPLVSLPEMIAHENTSPNIQLDQQTQE
ncbi:protein WVD2-like 7 isoform X2 [Actinidia eriantha]|uniref:protein WVD2-like 7 isoform X2 n=1 Tax=Actinidia eriantha TaxID=165200 RepID=UPI00258E1DB5|nr:protein WVD2-like 7 isoform X2 [Actinidia eriantha]